MDERATADARSGTTLGDPEHPRHERGSGQRGARGAEAEHARQRSRTLSPVFDTLPEPVRALLATLTEAGHEAVLVGGCVRDRARGVAIHDWDVATAAPATEVLALFPRAIPIGLRFGTVMVPTPSGPVDVTQYRGPTLRDDLARRDFTVNAVAFDATDGRVIDPFGGLADLGARRLRAVGSPEERLAEDPVRALRAARIVAELDMTLDPALREALPAQAERLAKVAPERIRSELDRLLAAPDPAAGIAVLRESGLEAALVPGARPDAGALIAALAPDLTTRWAAWLRGTTVPSVLARCRVPRQRRIEIETLLALHPAERVLDDGDRGVRRLRRRAGSDATLERLLALREAECAVGSAPDPEAVRGRLARLRERLAETHEHAVARTELALGGAEVMAALGIGPGPRVGKALQHLLERVLDDPSENTPERLRAALERWAASG
jgi:tRNA nucleotidyltransferase/poly(A) polymerase